MRDALWPGTILGYCTNVHAGATLDEVKANLEKHALAVKAQVSPHEPMGIGLWLAADVARELIEQQRIAELRDWLGERGLEVFTMNGFPYGNFHEPVVKHKVYEPNWSDRRRLEFTIDLSRILAVLLGDRAEGSISTLPVRWGKPDQTESEVEIRNLENAACALRDLANDSGQFIHLDIEPEPGCFLQNLGETYTWFTEILPRFAEGEAARKHIQVCLDVCHAAVMFDDLSKALSSFDDAGVRIGKVQVSNAPRLDLRDLSDRERCDAVAQLRPFAEDRYLHQTNIVTENGRACSFYDDLPDAIDEFDRTDRAGDEWRVHYHVPIYLQRFGAIGTTQAAIIDCLQLLRDRNVAHWEIETYAWNVLPQELQHETLADGIAEETRWLIRQAEAIR